MKAYTRYRFRLRRQRPKAKKLKRKPAPKTTSMRNPFGSEIKKVIKSISRASGNITNRPMASVGIFENEFQVILTVDKIPNLNSLKLTIGVILFVDPAQIYCHTNQSEIRVFILNANNNSLHKLKENSSLLQIFGVQDITLV